MRVLMVCLGNICRSPLAQGILRHKANKAGLNWTIDSAGTNHYRTGEPPHPLSQKVAAHYGISLGKQACRQFTANDMVYFDRIYVMDQNNYNDVKRLSHSVWNKDKVDLLLNEVYPAENKNIPDPYFGDEADYHDVYHLIAIACDKIIEKYQALDRKTSRHTVVNEQ